MKSENFSCNSFVFGLSQRLREYSSLNSSFVYLSRWRRLRSFNTSFKTTKAATWRRSSDLQLKMQRKYFLSRVTQLIFFYLTLQTAYLIVLFKHSKPPSLLLNICKAFARSLLLLPFKFDSQTSFVPQFGSPCNVRSLACFKICIDEKWLIWLRAAAVSLFQKEGFVKVFFVFLYWYFKPLITVFF